MPSCSCLTPITANNLDYRSGWRICTDLQDIIESLKQVQLDKEEDQINDTTVRSCEEQDTTHNGLFYYEEETPEEKEAGYKQFAKWLRQTAQVFVHYELDMWCISVWRLGGQVMEHSLRYQALVNTWGHTG